MIRLLRSNNAAHVRHKVQSFIVPDQELTLSGFCEKLDYSLEDFKDYDLSEHWHPKVFEDYMNVISKSIFESFPVLDHDSLILSHNTSTISTLDVPTGTPDFVACPETQERIHWTEIGVTVEIHSVGDNTTDGPHHAGSYTLLPLQARPDSVSVQGFYPDMIHMKGIVLIISSADGVKKSHKLNLENAKQYQQLIYAFAKRFYDHHPSMIDPAAKRRKDMTRTQNSLWVFDIMLTISDSPSVECVGYGIEKALEPVGRRTHIFVNNVNPTLLNTVIKDQSCYLVHRFNEAEVLRYVRAMEAIPRVVDLAHSEDIVRRYGTPLFSGGRQKKRTSIMDLKTPLEVLKVIYDLLETTRLLYFERKTRHRDISSGNLLYIEYDHSTTTELTNITSYPHNFCFIKHLLDPDVAPSATVNLLVDFHRDEIRNMEEYKRRYERRGKPRFMARAVRAGQPLGDVGRHAYYKKVPRLLQKAHVYGDVFPDRLTRFRHSRNSPDYHLVDIDAPPDLSSWRHELRHEAESAFWLLVWWAVFAGPDGCTSEIPIGVWGPLVDTTIDIRSPARIGKHWFDPAYAPLSELLRKLGQAVEYDLHWATETPYTHPDFLHEVFQRHILNFILENQDKEFMNLAKADASRESAPWPLFY